MQQAQIQQWSEVIVVYFCSATTTWFFALIANGSKMSAV